MGASALGCGLSDLFSPTANSHPPQDLSWAEVKITKAISPLFLLRLHYQLAEADAGEPLIKWSGTQATISVVPGSAHVKHVWAYSRVVAAQTSNMH